MAALTPIRTKHHQKEHEQEKKKKTRGKDHWTPTYRTSLFGTGQRQKPSGVRAQESRNAHVEEAASMSENTPVIEWRKNIDICKWSDQESQWKKFSNLPIMLTESTASVASIAQMVGNNVFGGDQAVLLWKIMDVPTTKGIRSNF